jgi:hypothetical protein
MSIAVNDKCGIKVQFKDRNTSVLGFYNAIKEVMDNPKKLKDMSGYSIIRADQLSWDKKAAFIRDKYVSFLYKFN